MKKDKNIPVTDDKEKVTGTNPENMFKKGSKGASAASVNHIITSAVGSVKAQSGNGLANEGTDVDYAEERFE